MTAHTNKGRSLKRRGPKTPSVADKLKKVSVLIEERLSYNKKVFDIDPIITNRKFTGERILVRMFKYPTPYTMTESGIEIPKFKNAQSDGGKEVSVRDEFSYMTKALVIKVPELATLKAKSVLGYPLKEGDIIQISPRAMTPDYQYTVDKDNPVSKFDGYLLLNMMLVESIEDPLTEWTQESIPEAKVDMTEPEPLEMMEQLNPDEMAVYEISKNLKLDLNDLSLIETLDPAIAKAVKETELAINKHNNLNNTNDELQNND